MNSWLMWLNKRVALVSWRIPGMGEPGGLLSLGLHRVGHDWSDLVSAAAAIKVPSFDDRALCCLLPLHLILSSFPDISWSSFLPSHLSPSVHQRNLSITSRPELGWPGLNTAFFCCQCEFWMVEWSSFKIYYVISCSKKWIWVAFSNLRV